MTTMRDSDRERENSEVIFKWLQEVIDTQTEKDLKKAAAKKIKCKYCKVGYATDTFLDRDICPTCLKKIGSRRIFKILQTLVKI